MPVIIRCKALGSLFVLVALGSLFLLAMLTTTSSTWACIPQARLVSLQPRASGPSGAQVTVKGLAFDPGSVEVRWNGSDGPRLATATGPDFAAGITIPDSPRGLYSVVVLSRSAGGAIGNAGSAAFQVTATDEAAGTDPEATQRPSIPTPRPSSSPPTALLVLGAIGLLIVGGLGGGLLLRWRQARPASPRSP